MAAPTQKPQGRKPRKARISQPAPKEAQLPQNAPDRFFALSAQGTSIATEFRAGLATFLTMAYIMFVNPDGLAARPPSLEPTFLKMNLSGAFNLGLVPPSYSRSCW
jgi:hypothetical protein